LSPGLSRGCCPGDWRGPDGYREMGAGRPRSGDAESNNIMVRERGPADARLIDFEAAGYAQSAARTGEAHRALPHLAGRTWRTADALRRRWPDADLDLNDRTRFPPYSPRQDE
jgi:hypothetical protein